MPDRTDTVARVTNVLTDFFDALDRREFFIEDLDLELRRRLAKALDRLITKEDHVIPSPPVNGQAIAPALTPG